MHAWSSNDFDDDFIRRHRTVSEDTRHVTNVFSKEIGGKVLEIG